MGTSGNRDCQWASRSALSVNCPPLYGNIQVPKNIAIRLCLAARPRYGRESVLVHALEPISFGRTILVRKLYPLEHFSGIRKPLVSTLI